jgi:pimeloyl-ACP methyl ester carboxylesterase
MRRSAYDIIHGIRIHSLVSEDPTDRPTLVFVHGLGVSTRYMEPTMSRLAGSPWRVSTFPVSARADPSHILNVSELAAALRAWLDVRGIGTAVFVGNSFGCQIIVECVARTPARTLGLVLNAPTVDPAHRSKLTMIWRVVRDVPNELMSLAVEVARDYLCAGPRRILTTLGYAITDYIEEKLPALEMHVLVVCGAHDPVVRCARRAKWRDSSASSARAPPAAPCNASATQHMRCHTTTRGRLRKSPRGLWRNSRSR